MRHVSNPFSLCFKSSAKSQGKGKSAAARRLWPFVRLALSHGDLITALTFSLLFTNHVNSLCRDNAGSDLCSMHRFFMNTSCQGDIIWFQNMCPIYIYFYFQLLPICYIKHYPITETVYTTTIFIFTSYISLCSCNTGWDVALIKSNSSAVVVCQINGFQWGYHGVIFHCYI